MIVGVLAQCTVTDLERAEVWYTRCLGREPDARPMSGLVEWRLGDSAGVQLWAEPGRAGQSTVVLQESDLDAAVTRLVRAGLGPVRTEVGDWARMVRLVDPDGNRVVVLGA